jgi:hypothetical protein
MKIIFIIFIIVITVSAFCVLAEADQPGTAQSKPNVSGGYDFYDVSGAKTGSSSKRDDGGYDYYDQRGNKTGSITQDVDTGSYEYRDAENIDRGSLETDPYGGYRFKAKGEDTITAEQSNIRRSYGYADPYGKGIETLSSDVIRGIGSTGTVSTGSTGLGKDTYQGQGLSTTGPQAQTSSQASASSGLSTITSAD